MSDFRRSSGVSFVDFEQVLSGTENNCGIGKIKKTKIFWKTFFLTVNQTKSNKYYKYWVLLLSTDRWQEILCFCEIMLSILHIYTHTAN